jgi:uncharacterized membrane protein YecN with MAPEG domain
MQIYVLCSATLVILYFLLAFNVSMNRMRARTGVGAGSDQSGQLNRSIRPHGNAAEYIPLFVVLFFYFGFAGAASWIRWVVVVITLCRLLHPLSLYLSADLNRARSLRFLSSVGTYAGGLTLGVALLLRAC